MNKEPVIASADPLQATASDRSNDCLASHIRDAINAGRFVPGQRLVTSGADAIRRATLLSSGEIEGHVH